MSGTWEGETYYGRPQLKRAPFNPWLVGGYVFLAGLSGAAALIGAVAEAVEGPAARETVRRGRWLALLAPVLGSGLLVWDLHTPKRFYNMLRIAKWTSPMSIGTWLLMGFSAASGTAAGLEAVAGRGWRPGVMRRAARMVQVPAAVLGAGLASYTSALLSATSTPLWAAAPKAQAVRFAASAMASGAAALSLLETGAARRRRLDALALAALSTELAAAAVSDRIYTERGVAPALDGAWGRAERIGGTQLGAVLPAGLQAASLMLGRGRPGLASDVACLAVLGGGFLFRVAFLGAGAVSADRPEISFRFAQPENRPRRLRRAG